MSLLAIQGLVKQFGARPLFALPELRVEQGSAIVLTGMNGVGKTTLLRILGGLERAHCDAAQFRGRAVSFAPYAPEMRQQIVYVHQHPQLFSGTVAANIAYGLRARGVAKDVVAHEVALAMAWAGVQHLHERDPRLLSGGETQRIALARAMVLRPALLLLDEPTANLDGAAREQVMALIPTLLERGQSVIMACHDRDLINLPAVQRWKLRDGLLEIK